MEFIISQRGECYVELTSFTFTSLKPITIIRYVKTSSYGLIERLDSLGGYQPFWSCSNLKECLFLIDWDLASKILVLYLKDFFSIIISATTISKEKL